MLFTSAVTGQSNYLSFGFTTLSAENCFIITKEAMSTAQDLTITQDERRKYACQVYVNMLRSGNHPISFVLTREEPIAHSYNLRVFNQSA